MHHPGGLAAGRDRRRAGRAWIRRSGSSADGALPRSRDHLVHRHPEWLLRPGGMRHLDPAGGSDFEGVYVDPGNAAAREDTLAVFTDIVSRYRVEGLHYDYVRYPQAT